MSNVRKEMVSGIAYTAIAKYSGLAVSLVVTAILARLFSQEEFGVVAIATVIISFFSIFCDLGVGTAVIQNQTLNNKDISSIFSFTIWVGIILTILFFFSSYIVASFYNNKILISICQLLTINLFFSAIKTVPDALLFKDKQFKYIAYRTLIVQLVAGSIAVSAALLGLGIHSLVINPIISSIVLFALSYSKYPQKFSFRIDWSAINKIFSFSLFQFLFNIINFFSRNLDKLIIGKQLGMSPLGLYEKSYRLMMLPLQTITQVVSPVMLPIYSKFQNDTKQLTSSYLKVIRLMAYIGFPISVLLFFTSKELIFILFGEHWIESIPSFKLLSFTVGFQIILSTSGSIFQAVNSTKNLFISGAFSTILDVIAICLGTIYYKSIEHVSFFLLITTIINFIQCYYILLSLTLKQKFSLLLKEIYLPIILALIIGTIIGIISSFSFIIDMNVILSLVIKALIALIIWILYMQLTKEYDIISLFSKYFKK